MYRVEAVNKGKVGYRYNANNIVTDIAYSLFLFLVYMEIILVFSIELIVDGELVLF